jgi:hypothetical protein
MLKSAIVSGLAAAIYVTIASPHSAMAAPWGTYVACSNPAGSPGARQAYVYTGTNYTGNCYIFERDSSGDGNSWTSWDTSSGFPNDAIRSVKAGSSVRLTLFWNSLGTGDNGSVFVIGAGWSYSSLGSWNGQASAARMVDSSRAQNCMDGNNELVLWTDPSFGGDCNTLATSGYTPWAPELMGFRNDSASAVWNASTAARYLYRDARNANLVLTPTPNSFYISLNPPSSGYYQTYIYPNLSTMGIDNVISSAY